MKIPKDKNYYTLIEIIYILRKHYQQAQSILNSMKDKIHVESNKPYNLDLYLNLKGTINSQNIPVVVLKVSKDIDSSIGVKIRNKMNQFSFDEYRSAIDHASFRLIGEDNDYQFKKMEQVFYCFQPEVSIPLGAQKKFSSEYNELKRLSIYSLPNLYIELNLFQSLLISGSFLFLSSEGEFNKRIMMSYEAADDKIHIESSKKYSTYFIEELLLTKIPKYLLPNEYILLLDSSYDELDDVFIDSIIRKRKENLEFVGSPKRLVLKREDKK